MPASFINRTLAPACRRGAHHRRTDERSEFQGRDAEDCQGLRTPRGESRTAGEGFGTNNLTEQAGAFHPAAKFVVVHPGKPGRTLVSQPRAMELVIRCPDVG